VSERERERDREAGILGRYAAQNVS
jgi:hypothetical protein